MQHHSTCSFMALKNPLCWSSKPFLSVGLSVCPYHVSTSERNGAKRKRQSDKPQRACELKSSSKRPRALLSGTFYPVCCSTPNAHAPITQTPCATYKQNRRRRALNKIDEGGIPYLPKLHACFRSDARTIRKLLQNLSIRAIGERCWQFGITLVDHFLRR